MASLQLRKTFPLREQHVPTLGMKYSHTGNQTFPYWGHPLKTCRKEKFSVSLQHLASYLKIFSSEKLFFPKLFVLLQLLLACRAVMSSDVDGADGWSTTY